MDVVVGRATRRLPVPPAYGPWMIRGGPGVLEYSARPNDRTSRLGVTRRPSPPRAARCPCHRGRACSEGQMAAPRVPCALPSPRPRRARPTGQLKPSHALFSLVVRPPAANVVPPAAIADAVAEPRPPRQAIATLPLQHLWHNLGKLSRPFFAPHWAKPSRNSSSGDRPAANPPRVHAGAPSGPLPTSNRPRRVPHTALGRSLSGPGRNPSPARSPGRPGTRLHLLQSF
jgi:hypothetical protein